MVGILPACDTVSPQEGDPCDPGPCVDPHEFNTIDSYPAWSPDGQHIAFGAGERYTGSDDSVGVWLIDIDGTHREYLGRASNPDRSPSGRQLALSVGLHEEAPYDEIALLDIAEGAMQRLTYSRHNDEDPQWSPDGTQVVWHGYYEGEGGIWLIDVDGSNVRLLYPEGGFPSWSPGGEQIVFHAPYDERNGGLWLIDADGTDLRPLTTPAHTPTD